MHQVFYIDLEEEVTSIIDRLRKSKSENNVFVIPIRALILGSVVSLKLIKKKAEEMQKNILVVTQDEQGRVLASKAGFETRDSLEGIDIHPENVGGVFDVEEDMNRHIGRADETVHLEVESEDERRQDRAVMSDMSPRRNMSGINPGNRMPQRSSVSVNQKRPFENVSVKQEEENQLPQMPQEIHIDLDRDNIQNRDLKKERKVFHENQVDAISESVALIKEKSIGNKKMSLKLKLIFWSFFVIIILLIAGVFAYMFLPKADIHVYPQMISEKVDISARAQTDISTIDVENRIIKAEAVEVVDSLIINKESTGEESASNQKSRGRVTIYNEFSEESQQLVATTRLESADGKIFRIIKGVIVPGMKKENGNIIPGSIEADVVADQVGDEYNIGPSEFKIPGFKSSSKYEKFYARSEAKMLGGGSQGGIVKVVSSDDIKSASQEAQQKLKDVIVEKIHSNMKEGYILDEDSIKLEIISESSFPVENSVAQSFEYQLEMKIYALVFSENDLISLIQKTAENKIGKSENNFILESIELEYGQITPDFEEEFLDISVHATTALKKNIDKDKILEGFLGAKVNDLGTIVSGYPDIRKVNVVLWPKILVNKIPKNKERVKIYIEESND